MNDREIMRLIWAKRIVGIEWDEKERREEN